MLYHERELEEIFDRVLAETGAVGIPEWLVATGRLHDGDAARWRAGADGRLVDALFGDPVVVAREIQFLRELARRRRLVTAQEPARGRAGKLPGLPEDWAAVRFRPAGEEPQGDLFMGGGGTAAGAHRLLSAIVAHERSEADDALAQLERTDPGHPLAAAAPELIARLDWAPTGVAEDWQAIAGLQDLAERSLGDQAAGFVRPLWERLARASAAAGAQSYQHPSAAWIRIEAWEQVLASLGPHPDALASPELLARGITALEQLERHRDALAWYFTLCWRFPEVVEVLEQLAELLNLDTALDAWDDAELAESLGWHRFPEWLTLGRWVPVDGALVSSHRPASYDAACAVVQSPGEVTPRRNLQATAPELFQAFMARR